MLMYILRPLNLPHCQRTGWDGLHQRPRGSISPNVKLQPGQAPPEAEVWGPQHTFIHLLIHLKTSCDYQLFARHCFRHREQVKIKTTQCNKGREKKTSLQGLGTLPGSPGCREAPKGGAERCGRKETRWVKTSQSYTVLPLEARFLFSQDSQ